MKGNKNIMSKSVVFFSVLLLSGMCFSASGDKDEVATQCESLAKKLEQMLENESNKPCYQEVLYSEWAMEGASFLIRQEYFSSALKNLNVAYKKLDKVYSSPEECAYFSPMIKSVLDESGDLVRELERLSKTYKAPDQSNHQMESK